MRTHRTSDRSSTAINKTNFAGGRGTGNKIIVFLVLTAAVAIGQSQPIKLVQITGAGNVFTAVQSQGDLNVFLASWNDDTTTITKVTDTAGNTYTQLLHTINAGGGGLSQDIWYAPNIKAAAPGNTLDIATSTGKYMGYLRIRGFEYSGVAIANVVSGTAIGSAGNSAHPNPGGIVITTARDGMLFCATKSQLGDDVVVQPPGFTEIYSDPDSYAGDEADDALNVPPPPPGWYGCSPTLNASGAWITQLAGFAGAPGSFNTLTSFNGKDGFESRGTLVQGLDANFYGTTAFGGEGTSFCSSGPNGGCGTFFRITPAGTESVLYNFCSQSNCTDGRVPSGNVVLATNGNFYGMTVTGGVPGCVAGAQCGTLFEITPTGKLTTVHSFCSQTNCADGGFPSSLMQAADGNFYGTTLFGSGACPINPEKDERYCGTVFQLTPAHKLTTLYQFCSQANCVDGAEPEALIQATNGNLYGVTSSGGTNNTAPPCAGAFGGCGTIFELPSGGKLATLYNFCPEKNCTDGLSPNSLVQGSDGNFYGTTSFGGNECTQTGEGCGTVFKVTPAGMLTTLYRFCAATNCLDGYSPVGLLQASDGNLYGTTSGGGAYGGGTVFEITRAGNLSTLFSFCANGCADGGSPNGLVQGTNGTFYGTTEAGGVYGGGTVFSFSVGLGPFVETLPTSGAIGANVTILGNNLSGATAVSFNGTAALFKVVSSTEITATVPNGATTGTVTVTTSSGTLKSNSAFQVGAP